MSDTDEDPVVDEVDVYLSKGLAENLYLFQYPVRPSTMPYDEFEHLAARIKPKRRMVELELGLETQNPTYDRSRGEQIAINVDGANPVGPRTFQSDVMDKQMLATSSSLPSTSRYAVGILKAGELHLTPLHGLMQLRPSFSYLDKADLKSKVEKMGENEGESSQEEEEEVKPVKVQFARPESDQAKARRLASYSHHEKMISEETWVPLTCQTDHDQRLYSERERLFCQATESDVSPLNLPSLDYLGNLVPQALEDETDKPQLPSNVLSMSNLKTMNLVDQVKALLINAKSLRFSQLLSILPGTPDPIAVLRGVQQVAMLVQGCWVVKSNVLYPKDTTSPISGVPADILCRGRDYVMWRFNHSRCIVRKEVASITKLPSEDMKDILEQLAVPRINQGWEFAHDYDNDFVIHHEEVAQRQQMLWDAKYQQLAKVLKVPKHEAEKKGKGKESRDSAQAVEIISGQERVKAATSRARSRSLSHQPSSSPAAGGDNPAASPKAATTNSHSGANPAGQEEEEEEEPMEVGVVVAADGDGLASPKPLRGASLKNGPSEEDNGGGDGAAVSRALQQFLRDKFAQQCILSLADMRRLLNLRLAETPPGDPLGDGVPDSKLEQCAVDIGADLLQIPWPSNDSFEDKKLFGFSTCGDSLDKFRAVIFDMFREGFKHRRNQFSERFREVLGSEPATKIEFDRLIKSLCHYKSPFWYLKGTLPT